MYYIKWPNGAYSAHRNQSVAKNRAKANHGEIVPDTSLSEQDKQQIMESYDRGFNLTHLRKA